MKQILNILLCLLLTLLMMACEKKMSNDVVAQNDNFTVAADRVTEGDWVATALSPTHIVSNYAPAQPPYDTNHGVIKFRLAINGHDNELGYGEFHYGLMGKDCEIVACQPDTMPKDTGNVNATRWHLRVDMREMKSEMRETGQFVTPTGDTIHTDDFKGVWLAGNIYPLSLHFRHMENDTLLQLKESSDPGFYEITVDFKPQGEPITLKHEWKIDAPNSNYPQVSTPMKLIDALYNLSVNDIANGIDHNESGKLAFKRRQNGIRMTYPIIMSLAYLNPEESEETLRSMIDSEGYIRHKHGHSIWPIITDNISWATAAWEVYRVTGDKSWLKWAYGVIRRTIDLEYDINADPYTGLIHGGVNFSFSDCQFYPMWMEYKDIYETTTFSCNVLYQHSFEILSDMSDELGIESDYGMRAQEMKDAINDAFWNEECGYYLQYTYMAAYPMQSTGIDNFGQAISVLWNMADDDRAENLIAKTPISNYGVPVTAPFYSSFDAVNLSQLTSTLTQCFWNLAAAKVENENMLRRGLGALYRAQALMCCNKGAYNCVTGAPAGNGEGDMGAAAGNAAMIFRIYAGLTFLPNGIEFNPFVPVFLSGKKEIKNFRYRKATLDITIEGTGNDITEFSIDGKKENDNFISGDIEGHHSIVIKMTNSNHAPQKVTLNSQKYRIPATPRLLWKNVMAKILNYSNDCDYMLMENGQLKQQVSDTTFEIKHNSQFTIYSVQARNSYAGSMLAQPFLYIPHATTLRIEQPLPFGKEITLHYEAPKGGDYYIDLRYANGEQSNICPLAFLSVNSHKQGTLVMPCRGEREWHNTGFSNMVHAELVKGNNVITLKRFSKERDNEQRPPTLHYLRIIPK